MAERAGAGNEETEPLGDLADVSNALVLVPSLGGRGRTISNKLLSQTPPEKTNVLAITYTSTPQEWVNKWMETTAAEPVRGGIVSVGQAEGDVEGPAWAVKTVENPGDLTGVGIELSELLSGMATASQDDEYIAVSFDSITSLLQYADLQRAFRFLHVVTGRVKTIGGTGFYNLDPEAHDKQTVATLKGLFDAVIHVDSDGSWTVEK